LILEDFENESKQDLPERVIDDRMNEIIHNTFNDDRAEFLRALSQQRMTIAEWREQLKEQIIIAILRRQEILDRVSVSPKAVYEVYQARSKEYSRPAMVKLRRIVIRVGATEEEQQVKRAEVEEVYRKLAAGEAFDALANTVSEDVRAARGGDWGWRNPDELNARLAEAISALKPGEYSEIVEVGDAFYILQVEGIKEASSVPFEDVRQEIEEQLEQEQKERLYQSWMERLRDKYFIKIF
jgi:parvulin-like peptidyl-prolyl isomerase